MIDPCEQWCIQIDVTNACPRACSNCTHLTSHVRHPYYMTLECFARCVTASADFPTDSPRAKSSPHKLVGIIGGEPLIHPHFAEMARMLAAKVPRPNRGLWTGFKWQSTRHADVIREVFDEDLIHNNPHDRDCCHTPILVSVSDLILDADERARTIDKCWLQERWSSSFTPKGFFLCEVAAALDTVFGGPGGLPIEPGCWRRPLEEFRDQIERLCYRCGVPLNLAGRLASEEKDDMSTSNVRALRDSPRVHAGAYVVYTDLPDTTDTPWRYRP